MYENLKAFVEMIYDRCSSIKCKRMYTDFMYLNVCDLMDENEF